DGRNGSVRRETMTALRPQIYEYRVCKSVRSLAWCSVLPRRLRVAHGTLRMSKEHRARRSVFRYGLCAFPNQRKSQRATNNASQRRGLGARTALPQDANTPQSIGTREDPRGTSRTLEGRRGVTVGDLDPVAFATVGVARGPDRVRAGRIRRRIGEGTEAELAVAAPRAFYLPHLVAVGHVVAASRQKQE